MGLTLLQFGEFELDCDRYELRRDGRCIKIEKLPLDLLILLAENSDRLVTRSEIVERLWGTEVFVDSEHGINTAVRKVRQTLRDDPESPRFVQTVTGRGYRFVAPVTLTGGQAALENGKLAVATPQDPLPDDPLPPAGPIPLDLGNRHIEIEPTSKPKLSKRARWLISMTTVGILATITAGVVIYRWRNRFEVRSAGPQIASLAVLPLDNLSGDRAQDYFADGMTDELTTMLAKNSTLRVVSRTSAMQYKGAHRPLREIAQALGVDGVLEGSVERSNNRVHMTVQLIQAPSDTHLWAESYDRDANDVVTLPSEAAQAIAKRLDSALPQTNPPRYINPAAHDAYLRGKFLWYTDPSGGEAFFKRATELQPDYAPGWSGLSVYYGSNTDGGRLNPEESLGPMEAAARKAVELDDSLPEAHLAMSAALLLGHWDWAGADREILRAIQLDPRYFEAHHFRAKILAALNRHQEAIEEQKIATELDPFARARALALSYQLARQYDTALADLTARLQSKPNDVGLLRTLDDVYRCKGMTKESVQAREQFLTASGDKASALSVQHAYERGGYDAVLHWQIGYMERLSAKQYVSPLSLAVLYAQLGNREKTLALLQTGYRERDPELIWLQCDPAYDFLHSDDRYRTIVREIGLPPAY